MGGYYRVSVVNLLPLWKKVHYLSAQGTQGLDHLLTVFQITIKILEAQGQTRDQAEVTMARRRQF